MMIEISKPANIAQQIVTVALEEIFAQAVEVFPWDERVFLRYNHKEDICPFILQLKFFFPNYSGSIEHNVHSVFASVKMCRQDSVWILTEGKIRVDGVTYAIETVSHPEAAVKVKPLKSSPCGWSRQCKARPIA